MKRALGHLVLMCAVCLFAREALAQSTIQFRDSVTTLNVATRSATQGRDFWLAPILFPDLQNYDLFISATATTTAYVQLADGPVSEIAVSPQSPVIYAIPLNTILTTSDTVERKALHLWCNNADLTVTFLPAPGRTYNDGTNIPPVTAWDTDYVLAAGAVHSYSSYVTIVSSSDSTIVTITPSCDVAYRASNADRLGSEKHKPFSCLLMRGESIQLWSFSDTSLSGTVIHSSRPIGVMTGSSYSSGMPAGPFANVEMMLPRRSWGKDYYTPSYGRTSVALVASEDNQVVYRTGRYTTGVTETYALGKKNNVRWLDITDSATHWFSDEPFMMVEYTTSGSGPSVVLQPREQWQKTLHFHTPLGYVSTLNIFENRKAGWLQLDGNDVRNGYRVHIDSEIDCITLFIYPNWQGDAHILRSDSALGAYVTSADLYYSSSYAYSIAQGPLRNDRVDTIAPVLTFDSSWYCKSVHMTDHASGLSSLLIDSAQNFSVSYDSGFHFSYDYLRWPDGRLRSRDTLVYLGSSAAKDSASITICIIDSLSPASYDFTVFNKAGNAQHYSMSYVPNARFFHPGFTTFVEGLDSCLLDQFEDFYIDATDTSLMRVEIDRLWTDSPFFTFDRTSYAENALPFNLLPGATHGFRLRFTPTEEKIYTANAYLHSPFAGTMQVPLQALAYPWHIGPVDAVKDHGASSVRCYPNPASDHLIISSPNAEVTTFELFNSLGEAVQQRQCTSTEEVVSLLGLPQGIYTYRISSAKTQTTGKLAILRQ